MKSVVGNIHAIKAHQRSLFLLDLWWHFPILSRNVSIQNTLIRGVDSNAVVLWKHDVCLFAKPTADSRAVQMGLSMPQHWRAGQQEALGLALSQLIPSQLVSLNSCLPPGKLHSNLRSCRNYRAQIPLGMGLSRGSVPLPLGPWDLSSWAGLQREELPGFSWSIISLPVFLGSLGFRTFQDVHLLYQADRKMMIGCWTWWNCALTKLGLLPFLLHSSSLIRVRSGWHTSRVSFA